MSRTSGWRGGQHASQGDPGDRMHSTESLPECFQLITRWICQCRKSHQGWCCLSLGGGLQEAQRSRFQSCLPWRVSPGQSLTLCAAHFPVMKWIHNGPTSPSPCEVSYYTYWAENNNKKNNALSINAIGGTGKTQHVWRNLGIFLKKWPNSLLQGK